MLESLRFHIAEAIGATDGELQPKALRPADVDEQVRCWIEPTGALALNLINDFTAIQVADVLVKECVLAMAEEAETSGDFWAAGVWFAAASRFLSEGVLESAHFGASALRDCNVGHRACECMSRMEQPKGRHRTAEILLRNLLRMALSQTDPTFAPNTARMQELSQITTTEPRARQP